MVSFPKATFFIVLTFAVISLISCTNKFFQYQVTMTHPVKSKVLEYENDTFYISFAIRYQSIKFLILNKLYDGMKINWDEVSFSINGKAQRAVHKETGVLKVNDVQPPTTIPPKSTLEDFLIPTSSLHYATNSSNTYTIVGYILPYEESGKSKQQAVINRITGTRITVFLPFYLGGIYHSKYYDFMIDDVILIKNKPDPIELPARR